MRYGTGMGLLWAFKFMLFPLGLRIPFLQLLFKMCIRDRFPPLGFHTAVAVNAKTGNTYPNAFFKAAGRQRAENGKRGESE